MIINKPMTGEQLDELMAVAVRMQRDAEVDRNFPSANFAFAVQVAVLELRRTRDVSMALATENSALTSWSQDRAIIDDALEQENYTSLKIDWRQRSLRNIKTPATDAWMAEVRATAITDALEECSEYLITDCVMDRLGISYEDAELRSSGAIELDEALICVANQLRQDANTAELVAAGIITKVGE